MPRALPLALSLAVASAGVSFAVSFAVRANEAPPTLSLPSGLKAVPLNPASLGERAPTVREAPPDAIATAWLTFPESSPGCEGAVDDAGAASPAGGGLQAIFCRGQAVLSYAAFQALAPTKPFAKGPHGATLSLSAERGFGHYDPAFVRWATRALIPAATRPSLLKRTQAIYDRQFRATARRSFLVEKSLSAAPTWVEREAGRYRAALVEGGPDVWTIAEGWGAIPGTTDDPGIIRMTTMWWLRRHLDATRPLWSDGLQLLLKTYDGAWLAAQIDVKASPPTTSAP